MSVRERIAEVVERKLLSDKNIERFLRYYWVVSTFRMVLGFVIMVLILVVGYKFEDLVPR